MSLLRDLADDRRSAKPWLPADDRDVTGGLVVKGPVEYDHRPYCVWHGAMAQVAPPEDDESRIFRCQEMRCGVGALWYPTNSAESKRTVSRAWDARYAQGRQRLEAEPGSAPQKTEGDSKESSRTLLHLGHNPSILGVLGVSVLPRSAAGSQGRGIRPPSPARPASNRESQ